MTSWGLFSVHGPWVLQDATWAGWALPYDQHQNLMPLALYAQDILAMAQVFMDMTGVGQARTGPRSLDIIHGTAAPAKSLEDRNNDIVAASFFPKAFEDKRQQHTAAGVRYAIESKKMVNNVDFALVDRLNVGHAQFFDFNEVPSATTKSVWVSAEGFFYVLSFRPADVKRTKFDTPIWILQAGCGLSGTQAIRLPLH